MIVGFVQMNVEFGEKEDNIERALSLMEKNLPCDLFVLPELFNTGYSFISKSEVEELAERVPEGVTTEALLDFCKRHDTYIVAGIVEKNEGKIYNSAVVCGPTGFIGKYQKTHLFYVEKKWFARGKTGFNVFNLEKAKIGVMICFDWIFPEVCRVLALKGAEIICHPSNLVLPYAQKAMLTRSIENKVFSITANRVGLEERGGYRFYFTGRSQITNPRMEVLVQAGEKEEKVGLANIDVAEARDKKITDFNHIFKDRYTPFYADLID